ncbi:MAG: CoA-binding protein [Gammaproteobacteria bacterium]|nr:CoA-binding protein [Gammaproteobacteria bacterium]MBU2477557.1 CoA-binding protein [Gammaproteobacteria bacterium]
MNAFTNPSPDRICALLRAVKTIAVVGLSPRPNRPSFQVSKSMQGFGYRIIPVRPAVESVLGEPAYPDLYALPEPVDLVNVFRNPNEIGPIVDACIALKLPRLWLQDGVINEAEALRAQAAGIEVVMDRCIYRDYLRLRVPH